MSQEDLHTLQEMPITAVALKPCERGSLRGAVTKGCAGLAPATAAVPGAFAAQDGTPTGYQEVQHQHINNSAPFIASASSRHTHAVSRSISSYQHHSLLESV